jgi:predicted DNA-binding transcriptional regulator AlpA
MNNPTKQTVTEDRTFHEASLYGSIEWVAVTMGMTKDTFFRRRKEWESKMGFPKPDSINGRYIKADVEAWIARRRKLADGINVSGKVEASATETRRIFTDEL